MSGTMQAGKRTYLSWNRTLTGRGWQDKGANERGSGQSLAKTIGKAGMGVGGLGLEKRICQSQVSQQEWSRKCLCSHRSFPSALTVLSTDQAEARVKGVWNRPHLGVSLQILRVGQLGKEWAASPYDLV